MLLLTMLLLLLLIPVHLVILLQQLLLQQLSYIAVAASFARAAESAGTDALAVVVDTAASGESVVHDAVG